MNPKDALAYEYLADLLDATGEHELANTARDIAAQIEEEQDK